MTIQEIQRIAKTLGTGADPKKYYVYTLVDSNRTPFYIGKGQGDRVWRHIIEALAKTGIQTNNPSWTNITNIIPSEIDDANLTDKEATIISNLLSNNQIELVIIKWGLTEEEAYMCESALINLQEFQHPGSLTNIVNGHASKKEKQAKNLDGFDTKARTVDEFLEYVAIDSVDFKTLGIEEPIVFITINPSMEDWPKAKANNPSLQFDDYVYECVRGYWEMDFNRAKYAKYVVALNKQVVIGVYCVNKNSFFKFYSPTNKIPQFPFCFRPSDDLVYQSNNNYNQYLQLYNNNLLGGNPISQAKHAKFCRYLGFYKQQPSSIDRTYKKLQGLIKTAELNNRIIKTRQGSVTYNYEVIGKNLVFYGKW